MTLNLKYSQSYSQAIICFDTEKKSGFILHILYGKSEENMRNKNEIFNFYRCIIAGGVREVTCLILVLATVCSVHAKENLMNLKSPQKMEGNCR